VLDPDNVLLPLINILTVGACTSLSWLSILLTEP
jgi:hypothetical protein